MTKEKFATKAEQGDFLDDKAAEIRMEIIRLAPVANGGHLSGGLSLVDLSVALYYRPMRQSPKALYARFGIDKDGTRQAVANMLSAEEGRSNEVAVL